MHTLLHKLKIHKAHPTPTYPICKWMVFNSNWVNHQCTMCGTVVHRGKSAYTGQGTSVCMSMRQDAQGHPLILDRKDQKQYWKNKANCRSGKGLGFVQKRNEVRLRAVSEATGFHEALGQIWWISQIFTMGLKSWRGRRWHVLTLSPKPWVNFFCSGFHVCLSSTPNYTCQLSSIPIRLKLVPKIVLQARRWILSRSAVCLVQSSECHTTSPYSSTGLM